MTLRPPWAGRRARRTGSSPPDRPGSARPCPRARPEPSRFVRQGQALSYQFGDHGGEPRVAARSGGPGEGQAQRVGALRGLDVQVVPDLHVVGDEPDRDHHHGLRAGLSQVTQVITDIGFQPRLRRRTAPALVGQGVGVRVTSGPFGNKTGGLGQFGYVPVPSSRPAGLGHRDRDAVRGEDQVGVVPQVGGEGGQRGARAGGERLDEARVVEEAPDLVDPGCVRADRGAGPLDVVQVLPAARVGAVSGGHQGDGAPHAVIGHGPHRVGQVRRPVPVPPVDGQRQAAGREVGADRGQQVPALLVDRAHPADRVVVLGHARQPLRRDAAAAGDVLQERHHLVGAFRAAERDKQEGVVCRHASIQPGKGAEAVSGGPVPAGGGARAGLGGMAPPRSGGVLGGHPGWRRPIS